MHDIIYCDIIYRYRGLETSQVQQRTGPVKQATVIIQYHAAIKDEEDEYTLIKQDLQDVRENRTMYDTL